MIRAILFDLDGTIVDTEPAHFAAFEAVLAEQGIKLDREDYFRRLIGFNDRECFATILKENDRSADEATVLALVKSKAARYPQLVSGRNLLYPGADRFVRECAQRFPLIIATGTLRSEAEMLLREAGLDKLFVDIVSADEVERSKPDPDCFLAALGRLGFHLRPRPGLNAAECLVIEDTSFGVQAAHRAGMKVLAVAQTTPAAELAAADLVRDSLAVTDLDDILRQLSG
jgi:beta-phosphoglucomutase